MRKTLYSVAVLTLGVAALAGCNNKSIETVDASKGVVFDSKRDGALQTGGGPSGNANESGAGTMVGKKPLPKAK